MTERDHNDAIVCDHFSGDWFSLHGPRFGQINGASIEGTGADMLGLAAALEARTSFSGENSRCRVRVDGDHFFLDSPRNSMSATRVPIRFAAGLVASIREEVAKPREVEAIDYGDDAS